MRGVTLALLGSLTLPAVLPAQQSSVRTGSFVRVTLPQAGDSPIVGRVTGLSVDSIQIRAHGGVVYSLHRSTGSIETAVRIDRKTGKGALLGALIGGAVGAVLGAVSGAGDDWVGPGAGAAAGAILIGGPGAIVGAIIGHYSQVPVFAPAKTSGLRLVPTSIAGRVGASIHLTF